MQGDITPEMTNVFTGGTVPRTLIAGELITALEQQTGVLFSGKTAFDNTQSGYRLGIDESDDLIKFYIGNTTDYINWNGSTLTIVGGLSVTSGTIGGFGIGSDYIRDVANSMGMASTVTGGDDVRFWAGDTFANRATANLVITESGRVTALDLRIPGGSLNSGGSDYTSISGNAYYSSGWKRIYNGTAARLTVGDGGSGIGIYEAVTGAADSAITWIERLRIEINGTTLGPARSASVSFPTTSIGNHLCIPSCEGIPTGVPSLQDLVSHVAMVYDRTNDNLYIYRNGWKKTATFT